MSACDLTFDQAMEIGDRHGLTSVQTEALWRGAIAAEREFDDQLAKAVALMAVTFDQDEIAILLRTGSGAGVSG